MTRRWRWRKPPSSAGRIARRWALPTPRRCRLPAGMPTRRPICASAPGSGAATSPACTSCLRKAKNAPATRWMRAATWRATTT
ncbi:Uncharacterised protein [Bordetella pertussis]|nr:Uncharacterised protein [Bordetella pertussis]